jgi:hypothetical protein
MHLIPTPTATSLPVRHPVGPSDAISKPTLQTVLREAKSKAVHFGEWHIPGGSRSNRAQVCGDGSKGPQAVEQ